MVLGLCTRELKNLKYLGIIYEKDYSNWRWTIDKPNDLVFTKKVYDHFKKNPLVCFEKIIKYIDANPELPKINEGTVRMEGYLKSLQEDNND